MSFMDQLLYMHKFFVESIGPQYTTTIELGILVVFLLVASLLFLQFMKG